MRRLFPFLLLSILCTAAAAQTFPTSRGGWTFAANEPSSSRWFARSTLLLSGKVAISGSSVATIDVYDPLTNRFTPGPADRARVGHTATLLPNGRVLLTGGRDTNGSCAIYDPMAGTVTPTGSLRTPRYLHTATLLPNGMVLVAGGVGEGTQWVPLSSCELYDPVTGIWSAAGTLVVPRARHTATLLADGNVLLHCGDFGGSSPGSAELYDPRSWTSAPLDYTLGGRAGHAAVVARDRRVYFIGGYRDGVDVFDPSSRSFGDTIPLVVSEKMPWADLLPDGRIVIAERRTVVFDPSTGQSVVTAQPPVVIDDRAVTLADGRWLVPQSPAALFDPRARGVPRGDLDGDGKADVLWHRPAWRRQILWRMNGLEASAITVPQLQSFYRWGWTAIETIGDIDGGGIADTIWYGSYYQVAVYGLGWGQGIDPTPTYPSPLFYDTDTKLAAAADFNGDGREEYLLRSTHGTVWIMGYGLPAPPFEPFETHVGDLNFVIAAADDFDGDGSADVLWRHRVRGENYIWFMGRREGTSALQIARAGHTVPVTDMNYGIAGTGDFNGDDRADIVWRSVHGPTRIWFMNGVTIVNDVAVPAPGAGWTVGVIGDFDGDDKSDIFWRNPATGENAVTLFDGYNVKAASSLPAVTEEGWITINP